MTAPIAWGSPHVRQGIPVRCELTDGYCSIKELPNLEHGTICRAFSLDPVSTWFDLPRSMLENPHGVPGRQVSGIIFRGPKGALPPIGKLSIARPGDKFADRDPTDKRDFFDLRSA